MTARLFDKVWDRHVVASPEGEPVLLYIDLHLVHEVTSPQAFEGLDLARREVRLADLTLATMDHDVPTIAIDQPIADPMAAEQIARLRDNCARHNITLHALGSLEQGIVHVIGPQLGLTQPGMTVVCGDSHTSTHGAFGALAFGIGTSEVEHVLATQTLRQVKPAAMAVSVEGDLPPGCTAKDLALGIIRTLGTGGGVGSVIEYRGPAIRALSMEGRMTLCNMSIEGGARAGMIAPDDTTFAFLEGRKYSPAGADWEPAMDFWRSLATDPGAQFDHEVTVDAAALRPAVTWGTNPAQSVSIDDVVPDPAGFGTPALRQLAERALTYMDLKPGTAMRDIGVDTVFIGSCTNGRLEDLREAAEVIRGRKIHPGVRALVVPGSARVKAAAEAEGLDRHFTDAGFEWRSAGCSMCLGMNGDILAPGERSASTSNRNFEGRQGPGGRTHLVSPGSRRRHRSSRTLQRTRRPVMAGIQKITGGAVALNRRDVDTDQIIPAAWLKLVGRTGFADGLFSAWRADPTFALNQPGADQAKVLVAGANFGCGSSREHAVWALQDYGFQAVVAPSFADIFRNNCIGSGLLPAQVSEAGVTGLFAALAADPQAQVIVDVAARTLAIPSAGLTETFELSDFAQWRLLEGLDDIALTLRHGTSIEEYEADRPTWLPLVAAGGPTASAGDEPGSAR